jgi:hypothetical protein
MSLLINSFKPDPTMLIGSSLNEKTMLIAFDTDEAPVVTTAVKLVEVNPDADTITYSTYPPDQLTSINNLETSTALTIHQYDVPGHAVRYGFHNQTSSQQDPWRIWSYHDDTKLFRQTGSGAVTPWSTLAKYQKIDSYAPSVDETVFANEADLDRDARYVPISSLSCARKDLHGSCPIHYRGSPILHSP